MSEISKSFDKLGEELVIEEVQKISNKLLPEIERLKALGFEEAAKAMVYGLYMAVIPFDSHDESQEMTNLLVTEFDMILNIMENGFAIKYIEDNYS